MGLVFCRAVVVALHVHYSGTAMYFGCLSEALWQGSDENLGGEPKTARTLLNEQNENKG